TLLYNLSLHDALPIWSATSYIQRIYRKSFSVSQRQKMPNIGSFRTGTSRVPLEKSNCRTLPLCRPGQIHKKMQRIPVLISELRRSEEHTSELQSRVDL